MILNELKKLLQSTDSLRFRLPNGDFIPEHFHITEVGIVHKDFIDCGGKVRSEKSINLQLWYSIDTDHRLEASKVLNIIEVSEKALGLENLEIEVEYQSDTIGKYGLGFRENYFQLETKQTACLAQDNCGIPTIKVKKSLSSLSDSSSCAPGGTCC